MMSVKPWLLSFVTILFCLRPALSTDCCMLTEGDTGKPVQCYDITPTGQTSSCNSLSGTVFTRIPNAHCTGNTAVSGASFCRSDAASVISDPILQGFDGRTFEFLGDAGKTYAVLSGPDLTVNMRLVEAGPLHLRHQGGEGTFVDAVAVLLPSLSLLASVDEAGNLSALLDGESLEIEQPGRFKEGSISYEPYAPDLGQVLSISSAPFKVVLVAIKTFTDEKSGYNRGHIDMRIELLAEPQAHFSGVLGESLHNPYTVDEAIVESQFEVPSLSTVPTQFPAAVIHRRLASQPVLRLPASASLTH